MTQEYGSRSAQVEAIIERVGRLTVDEAKVLAVAEQDNRDDEYYRAWEVGFYSFVYPEYDSSLDDALSVVWTTILGSSWWAVLRAKGDSDRFSVWLAAQSAVLAIMCRDRISPEQYAVLYRSWASVIGGREEGNDNDDRYER